MPKPKTGELPADHYWIGATYRSKCHECKTQIDEGDRAVYDWRNRVMYCEDCGQELEG